MKKLFIPALLGILFVFNACSTGEKSTDKKESKSDKSIEEITKKCTKHEGLFTVFQDTTSGSLYMLIDSTHLNNEFIHFSQVANGVLDAGYFKGSYRGSRIFRVNRYYDRIDFVLENTRYYYDEDNALHKARNTNINKPIILSEKIKARSDSTGAMLIAADDLFMSETFLQIKPSYSPKYKGFKLGKLSKDKSNYHALHNYPENTNVAVNYVYENSHPKSRGSSAVTDGRFVNIKLHHSLIAVPDNDYQVRYDDARVGYFLTQVNDMTSTDVTNYRDKIHRWNLKKKNPEADLSEPEKPIVWWIENTTPAEYRDVIKEAVLRWNSAFELIGFKNAVEVKVQPDDAEWDAGDIRYNVIRWTSSPRPPFGGYGPSFVNPRTGEILGADVMIEFASISNRLQRQDVFEKAGIFFDDFSGAKNETHDHTHGCGFGNYMAHATQAGHIFNTVRASDEAQKKEFINQILYRLMLHEVGHTLGLNHNFKGSLLNSPEDIHNLQVQEERGLASTVMEYPAINFAPEGKEQGLYFDTKPGPYDLWAIEFGYHPGGKNEEETENILSKILERSSNPELAFANDADDMRSAGKGIDPFAMIFDLTNDPITYSVERMELVKSTFPKLKEKYIENGENYHELRNAFLVLNTEYATALRVISRHVAGVKVDRSLAGQNEGTAPFTPLDKKEQQRAVSQLEKYAFAPTAFDQPDELLRYLQMQRRGFNHYSRGEDPRIHQRVLNIQKDLLNHLLHPNVLNRFIDTKLYGNEYEITEYLNDLTDAVFKADLRGEVNSMRRNLQTEYVERLIKTMNNSSLMHSAKSGAHGQLEKIKVQNQRGSKSDEGTKMHREYIVSMINKAMES